MNTAPTLQSEPTNYYYQAYGLLISSQIPLPELIAAPANPAAPADITIRIGAIARPPELTQSSERCLWATAGEACLFWADAGTILARGGNELLVEPLPHVDQQVLRIYLLGPALGVLLHQRGLLVLHASIVGIGDSAVAFVGESGWGKSTTAAALHRRGHAIVADDVAALQLRAGAQPLAFPAIPRLKLDAEPAVALGYPSQSLARFDAEDVRLAYRVDERFSQAARPLRRIYVLAEGAELALEPCRSQEAFIELVRHSYALRVVGDAGATAVHFRLCAQLAAQVPIFRLRRPYSLSALPGIVDLVEQQVQGV
ncbi:MAG TPA: hypothetical protein VGD69_02150 [Herpetosiphonaceae bacterium]